MKKTTLVETVPCVFGENGYHDVTIVLNENKMLEDIKCGCDEAREETEGLILLGTDEMKTCLGHRNMFIKQAKECITSSYGLPNEFTSTLLFSLGTVVAARVSKIRREREAEAEREKARRAMEAENDHVTLRLNEIISKALGDEPARVIQIVRREQGGKKVYCLGTRGGRAYNQNRGPFRTIAVRDQGEWVFPETFTEKGEWLNTTSSWGGFCGVCKGDGYRGHNHTKSHTKNMVKAIMIAGQATSSAGMRLLQKNPDHEFKYRKNSRTLVGVKTIGYEHWMNTYFHQAQDSGL